eukprot:804766-Pleurochrysis_carterae.AAC.1
MVMPKTSMRPPRSEWMLSQTWRTKMTANCLRLKIECSFLLGKTVAFARASFLPRCRRSA